MNRIWPGAVVMENTLQVHAAAVRKALGPYRGLLKTESRRGYRLLGDWTIRRDDAAKPPVGLRQIRATGDSPATNFPAAVTPLIGRSAAQQRLHYLVSAYRVVNPDGARRNWKDRARVGGRPQCRRRVCRRWVAYRLGVAIRP
jgi:non-specific serine/threonine protein kinase